MIESVGVPEAAVAGSNTPSDDGVGDAPAVDASAIAPPFAEHVAQRTVVLPELRVLFLPIPKAGCTSILWLLAELAGIQLDTFAESSVPEVSPALTVHDMSRWHGENLLSSYEGDERARILGEEGWLRFSVVRDPAPRLWSAWQSKLLLREPRFLADFGEEPWFPRAPERPDDVVEDFRRFVAALPSGAAEDVHWAVQHDLVAQLPLTHVGRVESVDETLELLRAHVAVQEWPGTPRRENRTVLPTPPHAFDDATAEIVHERYRADYDNFGYAPAEPAAEEEAAEQWRRQAELLLPAFRDTIEKHARIRQLHRLARHVNSLEERLDDVTVRQGGRSRAPRLANLEGRRDFNVRWAWADHELAPGFTAVVRVKNEARALPFVLPPLLRAVRHVVVVDNGSTDGTGELAQSLAADLGAGDRLEVHGYPFAVARCGPEHLATPADSLHSLAFFYNWSFSHVRTGYALKWDGDMVLTEVAVSAFLDLGWQLEASETIVKIPRYPLYVADERHAFLDTGLRNCEPWGWPNRPGYSFAKAMEWELPLWPNPTGTVTLPEWSCLELKHLDADEFSHWSSTDFEATGRQGRKRREFEVFRTLVDGHPPPPDVVPVESPEDEHVVDYVRRTWLPAYAAEAEARSGGGAVWLGGLSA